MDGDKSGRYLPKKVRKKLTPSQMNRGSATNHRKRDGATKGTARVAYSKSVNAAMRKAGVY